MGNIGNKGLYPDKDPVNESDYLIGTDEASGATKSFTLADVKNYISEITVVTSQEEFDAAVSEGEKDIYIDTTDVIAIGSTQGGITIRGKVLNLSSDASNISVYCETLNMHGTNFSIKNGNISELNTASSFSGDINLSNTNVNKFDNWLGAMVNAHFNECFFNRLYIGRGAFFYIKNTLAVACTATPNNVNIQGNSSTILYCSVRTIYSKPTDGKTIVWNTGSGMYELNKTAL